MRSGLALLLPVLLTPACGIQPEDSETTRNEPPRPFVASEAPEAEATPPTATASPATR